MIDQGELFDIPNPCRRICKMNNKGYCIGCFRSRNERLYWNEFTPFQKQLIVNLCEKRRRKVIDSQHQQHLAEEARRAASQLELFPYREPKQSDLF